MTTNAEFQRHRIFCRPNWRHERVLELIETWPQTRRVSRRDDAYVRRARNFILLWRKRYSEAARRSLYDSDPDLYYAYEIYEKRLDEPEPSAFMQARILAGQTNEEIAAAMNVTPAAVQWYEALFFNVRPRLGARDWVTKQVLLPAFVENLGAGLPANAQGQPAQPNPQNPQAPDGRPLILQDPAVARPFLDASLKLFAYFGGPLLLDIMITGFQSGRPLRSADDMSSWFDNQWAMTIRRRSAQAALTFQVNKFNVMELFNTHARIMEIEKYDDGESGKLTATEAGVGAMLGEIKWTVAGRGAPKLAAGRRGAELRDDELMSPEDVVIDAETAELVMPPPRPRQLAEAKATDLPANL